MCDETRPVTGRPELPLDAAELLLADPVSGTIVAVAEPSVEEVGGSLRYRVYEATIDRGREHGLREGHAVRFTDGRARFTSGGIVIDVDARTARIRARVLEFDGVPMSAPAVGWEWSTRWKTPR